MLRLSLLCIFGGLLCATQSCVPSNADRPTGLVRLPPRIASLQVESPSMATTPRGEIDIGVRQIVRAAIRNQVLAFQLPDHIALLDLSDTHSTDETNTAAPPPLPPSRRITIRGGTIELMYGPTSAGFPVLVTAPPLPPPPSLVPPPDDAPFSPSTPSFPSLPAAASAPALPAPYWLSDQATLSPVQTGLAPELGVQWWLPISQRGDELLLAASPIGQSPTLWLSRRGRCTPFQTAPSPGSSRDAPAANAGYFVLIPSGDGALLAAVRRDGARAVADIIALRSAQHLYSIELGPCDRDSLTESICRIAPLQWAGVGGPPFVPLGNTDDAKICLFGSYSTSVIRLPASAGTVASWNSQGILLSAMPAWRQELRPMSVSPTRRAPILGQTAVSIDKPMVLPGAWALRLDLDPDRLSIAVHPPRVTSLSADAAIALCTTDSTIHIIERSTPLRSQILTAAQP